MWWKDSQYSFMRQSSIEQHYTTLETGVDWSEVSGQHHCNA